MLKWVDCFTDALNLLLTLYHTIPLLTTMSKKLFKTLWENNIEGWLPTFSPFPMMFSKGFFLGVTKSWDYVIKKKKNMACFNFWCSYLKHCL